MGEVTPEVLLQDQQYLYLRICEDLPNVNNQLLAALGKVTWQLLDIAAKADNK